MQGGVVQVVINETTDQTFTGQWEFDRANGGTFAGPSGTTLPASPFDGEWFLKTDSKELYFYDGAAWQLIAGGATIVWGDLGGTLSDQTDLQNALDAKADDSDLTSHTGDATIHFTEASINIPASQISDFDAEVSNNTDVAANTSSRHDAVTVTDSSEIDLTLTGQDITASIIASSIDETKLDTSVNASLDLADSAIQSGDLATVATSGDHTDLSNIGTNTHAQVDTHIADGTIHFTNSSVLHNDRSDLQGGVASEYYHLKEADYTRVITEPAITQEFTGFSNPGNVVVTYNSVSRTVTLTGTTDAYWQGEEITSVVSGWESDAHPVAPVTGLFLSYNGTAFVWSTSTWAFSDLQIAYIAFASDGTFLFGTRETHGFMPWETHEELHRNLGTYRKSGGDVTGFTFNSTTAADRRPSVASSVIADEDLPSTLDAHVTLNNYTRLHLTGADGTPVLTTAEVDIAWLTGGEAQWNEFTGGVWTGTTLNNNEHMSLWLIGIPVSADANSQLKRYVWMAGQSAGSLTEQRNLTPSNLDLGEFEEVSPEFIFMEQVIIQETGSGNWEIIEQNRLTGNRFQYVSGGSGGVTDHGALTGLDDPDHPTEAVKYSDLHDHINNLQDVISHVWSAGACATGFDLTENGDGTVDITAGSAVLRSTNTAHGDLKGYALTGVTSQALTDNATNYVLADYNGGSPQIAVSTDLADIYGDVTKVLIYGLNRQGNNINTVDIRSYNVDYMRKNALKDYKVNGIEHASGSMIADEGSAEFSVTAGEYYLLNNAYTAPALDTSVAGTFEYLYRDGVGGWTRVASSTSIDLTQYDDGSGTLATLSNNKYGVHFVYAVINNPSHYKVVYGVDDYLKSSDAQEAGKLSELPSDLDALSTAVFIGKIIVEKGIATFVDIQSPFTQYLTSTASSTHNALGGLQGGTLNEYYHLTSQDYNNVVNGKAFTVTVAKTGGDFTTIQGAIDSVTVVSGETTAIKIHPGYYTENITMKNGIDLEGVGGQASIIEGTLIWPASTCTDGVWSSLNNIGFEVPTTQGMEVIKSEAGSHDINNCYIYGYSDTASFTLLKVEGGDVTVYMSELEYEHLVTDVAVATAHKAVDVTGGSLKYLYSEVIMYVVDANQDIFAFDISSTPSDVSIQHGDIAVENDNGAFTGEVIGVHNTQTTCEVVALSNHIRLTSSGGGQADAYESKSATTGASIKSASNIIQVEGFTTNYMAGVDTGDKVVSHFDDITAVDGYYGAGTYDYVNSPSDGDIQISGSYLNMYSSAKTVGARGADYTAIQDAIDSITDASAFNPYVVLVYPGIYTENVVMKDYVDLKGVGPSSGNVLNVVTGTGITFPATRCAVSDMTILVNATTTGIKAMSMATGGQHYVTDTVVVYSAIGTYGTVVDVQAGLLRTTGLLLSYTNTVSGGGDHIGVNLGVNGALTATSSQVNMDVASDDDIYAFKSETNLNTGHAVSDSVQINIDAQNDDYSSDAYAIYHTGSANGFHFTTSHVYVEATGTGTITGTGTNVSVSTNGATLRGTGNAVHVVGFASNYFANIGTGCTFISHYDDAEASDDVIGAGDLYRVGSTENGELRVSDSLKVGNVATGNYIDVDASGQISLFGTAKALRSYHLPVRAFGNGTAGSGTLVNTASLFFDDTVDEYRPFSFDIPEDIDATVNPIMRVYLAPRSNQSAGSDFVIRLTDIRYINIGDALDKTPDETNLDATVTVSNTRRVLTYTDITLDGTKLSAGEGVSGSLNRLATNVADDRNGDMCILGFTLVYTIAKVN